MVKKIMQWVLEERIGFGRLPLYVEKVPLGEHPEREFHVHDCSEIVFVLQGSGTHLVANEDELSARIHAGDVLIIHPGFVHAYDDTGDLEIVNIVYDWRTLGLPILDGYDLPFFRQVFPTEPVAPEVVVKPVMTLATAKLAELAPLIQRLEGTLEASGPGSLIESLSIFLDVVLRLAHVGPQRKLAPQRGQFLIGNAFRFIKGNYMRPITLEQMARAVHMSSRNFCRHFHMATGMTPTKYLTTYRLEQAKELLVDTMLSVDEVARRCGFCDGNYLSKLFRRVYRTTPRAYRLAGNKLNDLALLLSREQDGEST